MSLPNARGRPKEFFQINFNQDLQKQLKITKYGTGGRNWLAIACDGSPFKNFLALLPVLTICSTAGNTSTHLNNKDVEQIQLEFDHILPLKNFVWSM